MDFQAIDFTFPSQITRQLKNGLQPLFSFNVSCDEWLFIIKVL